MKQEHFNEHPLWTTLDNLWQVLRGDLSSDDKTQAEHVRLAHSVVQYVESLRTADPHLVDEATLTTLNNDLGQAHAALTAFVDDREANAAQLATAATSLGSVRDTAFRSLPPPTSEGGTRAAQEATQRYKDAADAEIASLRDGIEQLQTRLAELDEQRTEDARQAQESLTGLQAKITESEQTVATHANELKEQIETQRNSFDEASTQRESTFKEAETGRATAAEEERAKQTEEAAALISELEKHRKQARELLDATNRDVVSGDYRGWATKQAKSALGWTVATVVIGLITVGALVAVVLTAADDSVQFLLSKSTVGIIGLILAGYTARQAAEHRHEERTANRLALDLAALEPFLEHVENPEQLRSEIAKRVFVPEDASSDQPRFSFGRRHMTIGELAEFVKVIRTPPE